MKPYNQKWIDFEQRSDKGHYLINIKSKDMLKV